MLGSCSQRLRVRVKGYFPSILHRLYLWRKHSKWLSCQPSTLLFPLALGPIDESAITVSLADCVKMSCAITNRSSARCKIRKASWNRKSANSLKKYKFYYDPLGVLKWTFANISIICCVVTIPKSWLIKTEQNITFERA